MLNEPLSNLDAALRISVQVELKRLQKEPGITTIHVTHDQPEVLAIADKIVLVDEERIA